jgi:hypothetical protein
MQGTNIEEENGSSWFLVKVMKVISKMKMSPGIKLDVVIDQLGFPDDSPKTRMNLCSTETTTRPPSQVRSG